MKIILTILLSCMLCGCGYHLAGQEELLSGQVLRVYIPYIINQTSEPYVETILVSRLSQEMARQKRYSEVRDKGQAEANLTVIVKNYNNKAISYDRNDEIAEYRVAVTVDAALIKISDAATLWSQQISWQASYATADDKMTQSDRERLAVEEICQRVAAEILFQMNKRVPLLP